MFRQLTAALALLAPVQSFVIITHKALTYDRLDPIVNPGVVATHTHSIIGGNAFAPTMDYDTTQTSDCTTSAVQVDKSSYWSPTLYHRSQNGTFTAIPISFVQTYYLQRDGPTQKKITAFPKGLRMVAGNAARTSYNESNMEDKAINFVCLDYNSNQDAGPQKTFPQRQCKDGMRMQVNFPSCWDGVNLDSPDHKSHMSYPIGAPDSGDCPKSHPVKLVLLFNEWVYDVNQFDFQAGQDSWVLSNGDPTGLAFHADFINGWDVPTLQAFVDQCTDQLFGDLEKCAPFAASLNRDKASKCTKASVVQENALAPGKLLPGCNKYTPGRAPGAAGFCPNLAIPAIKGGPGASTMTASSAQSSSAAHTVSSSSAAASSATGTKVNTSSPAAGSTSVASSAVSSAASSSDAASPTAVESSAAATSTKAAVSSAAASTKAHHHHAHHTSSVHINPTQTHATGHATATAISGNIGNNNGSGTGKTGSHCKRDAIRDAKRQAFAEAKYKRAVHAHHAGIKSRQSKSRAAAL